jgi:hypothetical protein
MHVQRCLADIGFERHRVHAGDLVAVFAEQAARSRQDGGNLAAGLAESGAADFTAAFMIKACLVRK